MKKAIYTAIFGNYDKFTECIYDNDDYEYHLFTDNSKIKSNLYKIHLMPGDQLKAREIKLLPHKYLPDYDYSVWTDGNIVQVRDMNELASKQNHDFMAMKHELSCIYAEAKACIKHKKDNINTIHEQMQRYVNAGFPPNMGLIASGVLLRKHTAKVKKLCENWWKEIQNGSIRDQLSFNYVLDQQIDLLPFSILKTHFIYSGHNNIRK